MKARTLFILGIVTLLMVSAVSVTPAQSAPAIQTGGPGAVVSSPMLTTQTTAGAGIYWTAARMAAAVPLDVVRTKTDGQAPSPASMVATGTPASVAGNPPGKAPVGLGIALQEGVVSPVSAAAAWYSYPFPYTRTTVSGGWQNGYPWVTNGKLFFTQYGTNYVCSATSLTSGGGNQRLALTAGHCAHAGNNDYSGGWSYNVLFCPAYNNGAGPWGCWTNLQSWTFTEWATNGNLKSDVAILVTGDASTVGYGRLGDTIGTQGLAWNQSYVQSFWEFGYPQASPFNGKYMMMSTSSTAEADNPWGGWTGNYTIGVGSDLTGGASGGGWLIQAKLGNVGYLNGLNSYKYISPDRPLAMYGPYFDTNVYNLWAGARTVAP